MPDLETVLSGLNPDTKARLQSALDIQINKIETPSIGLTQALNGGLGFGRQVSIWGPKSAGKSTFVLQLIGQAQKQGLSCAFLDAEGTYDPKWGERLGVNNEELIYSPTKSVVSMTKVGSDLISSGVDICAVDSITSLMPSSYMDDEEVKDAENMGRVGALSADLSKYLPVLNYQNEQGGTLLILISQARQQAKGMYWSLGMTGGEAVKFYSSQVIKLYSSEGSSNTITGDVQTGNLIVKKPIGRKVTYTVEFNKLGPQGGTGSYDLYYEGDFVGIDSVGETFDVAVESGVIERSGAFYKYNEKVIGQGRQRAIDALREDQTLFDKIEGEI